MASTFSVGLEFSAKTQQLDAAVAKLNSFDRAASRLKGVDPFQGAERGARGAGAAVDGLERKARSASGAMNGLAGAVKGLVGAYALLGASKFIFGKTAELETQTRSIQVLTGSLEKAKSVIGDLQQFANVTPFTSTELIDAAKRLKAYNVDTDKLVDTTKRLGDVAGATGADLNGLVTAYGQVMSKQRLQAEENMQFTERGVDLQGELQKIYKLSGAEFADAMSKGKISAEAVELALKNLTSAGGKYANGASAQSDTLTGKFSTLQDNIEGIARSIGSLLTPAINGVLDIAIKAVNEINSLLETQKMMTGFGGALPDNKRAELFNSVDADAQRMARLRYDGGRSGKFDSGVFASIKEQLFRDRLRQFGYDNNLIAPPKNQAPSASTSLTPPPLLEDSTKEKEKKEKIDKLYDYANQNAAQLAQNEIDLNREVFNNEMALLRQRYEQERTYVEKLAGLRGAGLTPGGRETFGAISQFNSTQQGYADKLRDFAEGVKTAEQALKDAKSGVGVERMQSVNPVVGTVASGGGSSTGRYIQGGYGPSGPNAYGPHFDIKRQDGNYFGRNALDQFVTVNGKPLSSGLTVPGGQFGASRDGGARTHNAWDYAFGGRAELQLQNGAKWMGSSSTSYGDNAVFQTPDGKIYRIIHGTFSGGSGGGKGDQQIAAGGQADLTGALGAQGDVATAQAALDGAKQRLAEYTANLEKLKALDFPTLLATMSQGWRDQTTALEGQTAQLQLRTRLELEGVDSAIIDGEVQKLQISQQLKQQIEGLDAALKLYNETQGKAGISAQQHADALKDLQGSAAGAATAVTNQAQMQQAADQAQQAKSDAQGISSTIGSGLKDAIKAAVTGGDVKAALGNMLGSLGDKLLDMAMRPLEEMLTKGLADMFSPQKLATDANTAALWKLTAAITASANMQSAGGIGGLFGGGSMFGGLGSMFMGGGGGMWGAASGVGASTFMQGLSLPALMPFADGGSTPVNQPVLVGERGPEIFVPGQSGGVTNHQNLRSLMASGGGGGKDGGGTTMNMSFETTQFMDREWVDRQQLETAMATASKQGAAQGERRALDRLRQSPRTRRSVGL